MTAATPHRRTERAIAVRWGNAIEQFDEGRWCAHPACDARLSRYNPSEVCAAHGGWRGEPSPRRRRRG